MVGIDVETGGLFDPLVGGWLARMCGVVYVCVL